MKDNAILIAELASQLATSAIQAITKHISAVGSKPYLTQDDMCNLTGWSKRQLAYKRQKGELPYLKRGRTIWYKTVDVVEWIEKGDMT